MKTYISILLVVLGLVVIVSGGYVYMKKNRVQTVLEKRDSVLMKSFTGDVTRVYEGDNKLSYSFDIPEIATTTVGMDGALIKVSDATSSYTTIYISYEGGRGFGPIDYMDEVIAPHVSVINANGTTTIGNYEWQVADSEGSEWHIASIAGGSWLVIVENRKNMHDLVQKIIASLKAN